MHCKRRKRAHQPRTTLLPSRRLLPADLLSPNERFELASIGIEKGKPFHRGADQKAQLTNAVRLASAIARANTFAPNDPARLIYPDRRWEWLFIGGSASWDSQG